MWSFEDSVEGPGSTAAVWAFYEDVENWKAWSPAVVWSRINGPFVVGSKGKTKFKGLPASSFRLVEVERERAFSVLTRLPGGRLVLEHRIETTPDGIRIKHRGEVTGPLAGVIGKVIGSSVRLNLPAGIQKLALLTAGSSGSSAGP